MPWHSLWPDFLKKRLCRYLLQHYLGHFFKEKISLEQLSIDIYNGTGCVKNLNLDCDALNEQLNQAAAATSNTSSARSHSTTSNSPIPIEIVSGFVGYISVYIPWHDLFNDYCKLTIKNVQITIRTKQRKHTNSNSSASFASSSRRKSSFNARFNEMNEECAAPGDDQLDLDDDMSDSNSNSMFSSMIVDSLMNTSIHIAQECLNEKLDEDEDDVEHSGAGSPGDDEFNPINKTEKNSLLGLEAFASTIDSILSRIKINIEQIQIRIENLDASMPKLNESHIMSSSAVFSNRPSNGIALELRIKSIKYFDLDSTNTNAKTDNQQQAKADTATTKNLRNTTKSFNIEGLTVYFDEFIVKDDPDMNTDCLTMKPTVVDDQSSELTKSLNSTIDLSETSTTVNANETSLNRPQDESPPFSYDLNPDYYLYTNPIILITFSGIQSIKLTINNMRPTDLILEQANNSGSNTAGQLDPNEKIQLQLQRPFLELNAQFGSIKCLASPKQIHLLIDMFTKLNDYIEAANATRKQFKSSRTNKKSKRLNKLSSIRGCDKRKFEALIQNDLMYQQNSVINETNKDDDNDDESEYKINFNKLNDNETSVMFYSMMSESSAFSNKSANSPEYSPDSKETDETTQTSHGDSDCSDDKQTQTLIRELKQTIEQLQQDVIQTNSKNTSNLFQTFRVTFRMFSLTVLHHDPPVSASHQNQQTGSDYSTKRMLVERMKSLSDSYFDWVSTIDASAAASSSSTGSIDKNTVLKYHQACAFNDHFLVLLKPINLNLVQKINQRFMCTTSCAAAAKRTQSQIIQYSLNEITLSVGYIQVNEYLVAAAKKEPVKKEASSTNKRFRTTQILEACQAATITEIVHFADSSNQSIEQPCLKINLVTYEPLELLNNKLKQLKFNSSNTLLNNMFENIQISLNQSLICELDISIIDRLYYLLNDTLSPSKPASKTTSSKLDQPVVKMTRNFEIKCSQIIKIGLRFPIADWRRTQPQQQHQSRTTTTSVINETTPQPVTLISFRNLREQILTLHLFEFNFQTLLSNASQPLQECLSLNVTSSQINAYYQYSKKDRPIHFGLIQQKSNEPRSLICSIRVPKTSPDGEYLLDMDCQLLSDQLMSDQPALDSLKTHFNINVSKPNRLYAHKEEENDLNDFTEKEDDDLEHKNELINDEDDSDDEYSPFSRIHSLISSEKNRRIVNAGNKAEMQSFISQSKLKSSTVIKLSIPQLKFLIADQKFLNDIYNCLLNDLIMWVPSPVPPIESQLIYDSQSSYLPSLNFMLENDYLPTQFNVEDKPQQFHMCRSAILKPQSSKSDSENSDYCESDDDQSKQKYKQQFDHLKQQQQKKKLNSSSNNNKNTLAFILNIDLAHLKAFVLNVLTPKETSLKYGEFDIKTNNFQMCIAISEAFKTDTIQSGNKKSAKSKQLSPAYKIEKQQICIFTDQINISHSTKQCPPNVTQLKYPTNYSSFETLFQMSKTKDLITVNDQSIVKSLFQSESGSQSSLVSVPMVSIGIKSKFNLKKNTKQLLVALNFSNLSLHHLFCAQTDYWIFQLIQLFDLIDIEIIGYEVPIVLTELHLNVANSCIIYKPVYLATNSLIAFKSLHWSSNVTAESSLTLLVFNIEDIYLFLARLNKQSTQQTDTIDLKKDYICVANSDLFELRLLISEEPSRPQPQPQDKRKSPILDIKIRSNLIQLRTCVDSAFTLIELINYIVSDGDLHQPNLIISEFMSSNSIVPTATTTNPLPSIPSNQTIEMQPEQAEIASSSENSSLSKAITSASSSIPIQAQQHKQSAVFTVGTPPSSFKSSASSASLSQQALFYTPLKSQSPDLVNQSKTQPITMPLPSPSLSYVNQTHGSFNASSSAESFISDMVKEAMHSNPMTQSVYGSLTATNENESGARKRNPSLTLLSPDLQTKRLISQSFMQNNEKLNTLKETASNLSSSNSEEEDDDDEEGQSTNKINFMKELKKKQNAQVEDEDDDDESLIASIHFNHKLNQMKSKLANDEDDDNNSDYSENTMNKSNEQDDDEEFHFDLPFSNISPMVQQQQQQHHTLKEASQSVSRQLMFDKNNRRLHFKPAYGSDDEDSSNYARKHLNQDEDDEDEHDEELLRDFDIIDVIPGFGEPPRNNQDFEIKILKRKSINSQVMIKEDHFKKPLTKIDVLKAPDSYPCPLNVYCIQEISINWCMYGGSDFGQDTSPSKESLLLDQQPLTTHKINRTVSSPIIVNQQQQQSAASPVPRSRNSSTSSNSLSMSPQQHFQSPTNQSPSAIRFSKTGSINFTKQEKYLPRKAGGRIAHKYDTQSLNWLARGGKSRNLDVCMEIALYKVKTKIDMYSDLNDLDDTVNKENKLAAQVKNESPYLYRVALAIGDIEIRDKLASSPFNMFLFRYESEHCPKHTNSNMLFVKFLCSKSMDSQRLIECDIKVSIQPLRFNIDQDALIFLVEFFTKLASRDLNEFSKSLIPPPPPPLPAQDETPYETENDQQQQTSLPPQTPQQIFIRNFIFSPDLLVRFDFSGKYDSRSDTKMDTLTKLLMVAIQLSNTEIKLKRICYRRGFLGAEKLMSALIKEWLSDIQRNQMKNLIKGWGIFNSLIQFFEGFTYLIWYPIEQYRKDGRVLCGIQKGSAAFSTCTVLATIELTNRMFQATKNIAEFFYDLVTPHRAHHLSAYGSNSGLVDTILTGVGNNRNIRLRRHPNDIREGLTNAYYVMYEGMNETAANLMQEINQGAEHKGLPGAIGGALRQLPSTALAPIVLTTEATCNILSGIRNQLKPDEKRDDDQKWKTIAFNS